MAEAIASAVPSATCSAGMPTSTPVRGDEPNEPHANAQAMEVVALLAIAAQQNVRRPGRVEEHKRDGAPPVTGCRSEMETAALGHGAHDGGAGGVAREADPEENQMRAPSACRSCVRRNADCRRQRAREMIVVAAIRIGDMLSSKMKGRLDSNSRGARSF